MHTKLLKKINHLPRWAYMPITFISGVIVQAAAPDSRLSTYMALAFILSVTLWVLPTGLKVFIVILKLILFIVMAAFWTGALIQLFS